MGRSQRASVVSSQFAHELAVTSSAIPVPFCLCEPPYGDAHQAEHDQSEDQTLHQSPLCCWMILNMASWSIGASCGVAG